RLMTKKKSYEIKKNPELIKELKSNFTKLKSLLDLAHPLAITQDIENLSIENMVSYGLLPNDALIAATCKRYGIKKIATFDEDFKKIDFLEFLKVLF
ncbi:MAG: PIN domain-containing protein, partial [Archaeoglobaceae archaeon]|nr:PIN domain-containing protein [Archaeoglobaceae archaeon]